MKKILFASIVLLTVSVKSQEFDFSFKETFDLAVPANLIISADNSNIEVVAHEKNSIEVFYIVQHGTDILKSTKEEIADQVGNQWKFDIQKTKNELEIHVLSTVIQGYINSEDAINVHFRVFVPEQTSTTLRSSDGNILLKGLALEQYCVTSDGDIKLVDLNGKVFAKTSDGDVILDNVTGKVDSHTTDGRVIKLASRN